MYLIVTVWAVSLHDCVHNAPAIISHTFASLGVSVRVEVDLRRCTGVALGSLHISVRARVFALSLYYDLGVTWKFSALVAGTSTSASDSCIRFTVRGTDGIAHRVTIPSTLTVIPQQPLAHPLRPICNPASDCGFAITGNLLMDNLCCCAFSSPSESSLSLSLYLPLFIALPPSPLVFL